MNAYRNALLLVLSLGLLVVGSPLTARGEITKVTLKVAGMT
ncbi:MAG: hypothetical protein O7G88_19895 [bacterium]|nr:hypothetical protein [bacterium]